MPVLSPDDIDRNLQTLTHWELLDNQITRNYVHVNFIEAIRFVTELAELAEDMDHHPDILVHSWNNVCVTLSTHSEGGLTEKDFDLAGKIETLFVKF
jgi:4a-hydroxytetrahydrobiopterin dehydratase